jgi:hypothetical protein
MAQNEYNRKRKYTNEACKIKKGWISNRERELE